MPATPTNAADEVAIVSRLNFIPPDIENPREQVDIEMELNEATANQDGIAFRARLCTDRHE